MTQPGPSLCGLEVHPGFVAHADQAGVGYVSIAPPLSFNFEPNPKTYQAGFNHHGKIIGCNAKIPYPGELPKYHHLPFLRHADWAGGVPADDPSNPRPTKNAGADPENKPCSGTPDSGEEIDEYFTADNDEGYEQWVARKSKTCETEATKEEQPAKTCLQQQQQQPERNNNPKHQPFPALTNHQMPVRFDTTNQTYGSYIDLKPNYRTHSTLRHQQPFNNITTGPLDPIVGRHNVKESTNVPGVMGFLDAKNSARTITMTAYTPPEQLPALGLRCKSQTFPLNSPTGLELNRISLMNHSCFATMGQQPLRTRPARTPLGKIVHPPVYRLGVPYCPGRDRGLFNTSPGVMCLDYK